MQVSRKLSLAALAAVAAMVPVGLALAASPADPAPGGPAPIVAPLAGHRNVDGQMRRAAQAQRRRARRHHDQGATHVPPILSRIAECESHSNPRSIGGGGLYRGAYQFTVETYRSVGGHGDPVEDSMAEQTKRAAILLARSGPSQWPVCSGS
jgi:Transglycosylase-like domain